MISSIDNASHRDITEKSAHNAAYKLNILTYKLHYLKKNVSLFELLNISSLMDLKETVQFFQPSVRTLKLPPSPMFMSHLTFSGSTIFVQSVPIVSLMLAPPLSCRLSGTVARSQPV